ncbi:MAG: 16S rRNA (cytidine(1402)-2'-O)-methyltransferase [Lachnospiraceae bacterium]|nr:16S rRNA (cytidine(1402)-2'-O)-methyltransferase [Lachnospiraceae bacterium]
MSGTLYVVATPIGNCADITERARTILRDVDIIAAEDTRTTQVLLNMLDIRNKMVSNHKFNEQQQLDHLLSELNNGKNVAVVSDAGTPCISDPGSVIVKGAVAMNIPIIGVSGPTAVITALSISGFSFDHFAFYGFVSRKDKELRNHLMNIKSGMIPISVFFESPHRIIKTIGVIADIFPEAELCLCNDLTKMFERVYRGTPTEIEQQLNDNPNAGKGEYTLVMNTSACPRTSEVSTEITKEALLVDHMITNRCSSKEAIVALTEKYRGKISRKEFYTASLNLKEHFDAIVNELI